MTKEAFGKFLTSFIALHLLLLLCKQHHHTPHFWRSELLVFSKLVDNISPPVLSSPSDSRPIHDMFLVYHAARLAGYCLPSPELDLIMKTHMKTLFFGDELPTTSQKTYRKWILAGGISATHFSKEHQQRNKRDDRTQDSPYRDASPPGNRCKKSKIRWRIWQAEPTLKLLFVTYVSNEMDHERFAWQLCKLIKKAVPHTEEPEGDEAQHMLTGTRSWVEKKLQALDSNIISVFDTAKHIFIHMKDELRTLLPSFILSSRWSKAHQILQNMQGRESSIRCYLQYSYLTTSLKLLRALHVAATVLNQYLSGARTYTSMMQARQRGPGMGVRHALEKLAGDPEVYLYFQNGPTEGDMFSGRTVKQSTAELLAKDPLVQLLLERLHAEAEKGASSF